MHVGSHHPKIPSSFILLRSHHPHTPSSLIPAGSHHHKTPLSSTPVGIHHHKPHPPSPQWRLIISKTPSPKLHSTGLSPTPNLKTLHPLLSYHPLSQLSYIPPGSHHPQSHPRARDSLATTFPKHYEKLCHDQQLHAWSSLIHRCNLQRVVWEE